MVTARALALVSSNAARDSRVPSAMWILIAVFLGCAFFWALRITIPTQPADAWSLFNPDEHDHINTLQFMAERRALPPYQPGYMASQHPPLYHAFGALVYAALRPQLSHSATVLLLRLISCVMGAGVIWFTFKTARLFFSEPTSILAAVWVAGVPMFVSLSAAVTNENLSTLAASASIYTLALGIRKGFSAICLLSLALCVSAAISTKVTCLGLLPASWLALWMSGNRHSVLRMERMKQILFVTAVVSASIGWWFVRNVVLFGDPFRKAALLNILQMPNGNRLEVCQKYDLSPLGYLWSIASWGYGSFWGTLDAMRVWLPAPLYVVLTACVVAATTGIAIALVRAKSRGSQQSELNVWAAAVGIHLSFVVFTFYRFNWEVFGPQGRYFFPALLPFGIYMAAGWRSLFPRGWKVAFTRVPVLWLLLLNLFVFYYVVPMPKPMPNAKAIIYEAP